MSACLFLMAMPTLSGIMGAGCSRGSQAVTVRISGFAAHKSSKFPSGWPAVGLPGRVLDHEVMPIERGTACG